MKNLFWLLLSIAMLLTACSACDLGPVRYGEIIYTSDKTNLTVGESSLFVAYYIGGNSYPDYFVTFELTESMVG